MLRAILWGFVFLLPLCGETVKPYTVTTKHEAFTALGQVLESYHYHSVDGKIDKNYHRNSWYYEVGINGKKIEFCLDTGCTQTTLPPSLAEKAGVTFSGEKTEKIYAAFSAKEVKDQIGIAEDFVLGPMHVKNAKIQVFQSSLSQGLIGMDFLLSVGSLLDLRAARIYLGGKGRKSEVNTLLLREGYTRIPLMLSKYLILGVPVQVKQTKGIMILDTGAFVTSFIPQFAQKAGVFRDEKKLEASDVHGTGSDLNFSHSDIFNVGTYSADGSWFTIAKSDFKAADDENFAGFLGIDFLGTNNAVIDLETKQLYLHP